MVLPYRSRDERDVCQGLLTFLAESGAANNDIVQPDRLNWLDVNQKVFPF